MVRKNSKSDISVAENDSIIIHHNTMWNCKSSEENYCALIAIDA